MNGDILANRSAEARSGTDFYETPKNVTVALLRYLKLPADTRIYEPACGAGAISEVLKFYGYTVYSTDLHDTGYGTSGIDFLKVASTEADWIITNPPFSLAPEFIQKCISLGKPFALLLKSQFWHAKSRFPLFYQQRPTAVLPLTWRPDFLFGQKGGAPTMECVWTVWQKDGVTVTEYDLLKKPF